MKEISASTVSMRTRNPIRQIVDQLKITPNPDFEFISLALGDPTIHGNLKINKECLLLIRSVDAVERHLHAYKSNGYNPSVGQSRPREAIANKSSYENIQLSVSDIIIASGCSGALDMCISVLCNESQNILLPAPGFSLYETLASSKGIQCRFYNLLPAHGWEIDLAHLESLIDENTACILMNNPSNPCGSVYTQRHLIALLELAERHSLPIIADEIYADMVFEGYEFHPLASLTNTVPILSCGGLAKKYMVPGWRVGWICIYDHTRSFTQIRVGLNNLSQLIIGANSLVQAAIPEILETPKEYNLANMAQLEANVRQSIQVLSKVKGLDLIVPKGAMYMMIGIDIKQFRDISSDTEFVEGLVKEQAVLCLPGSCFRCPTPFIRIVTTSPIKVLEEAFTRIKNFCDSHLIVSE